MLGCRVNIRHVHVWHFVTCYTYLAWKYQKHCQDSKFQIYTGYHARLVQYPESHKQEYGP